MLSDEMKKDIKDIEKMKKSHYHEVWREQGELPALKKYFPKVESQEALIKEMRDLLFALSGYIQSEGHRYGIVEIENIIQKAKEMLK